MRRKTNNDILFRDVKRILEVITVKCYNIPAARGWIKKKFCFKQDYNLDCYHSRGLWYISCALPSHMYSGYVVSLEKISLYVSEIDIVNLKAR